LVTFSDLVSSCHDQFHKQNEGYGNTEEFGKLEIENYCMGGTGVIISQGLMLEESDYSLIF